MAVLGPARVSSAAGSIIRRTAAAAHAAEQMPRRPPPAAPARIRTAAVIGGGIGGLATAIASLDAGIAATVHSVAFRHSRASCSGIPCRFPMPAGCYRVHRAGRPC